jgi:hypothetical protein
MLEREVDRDTAPARAADEGGAFEPALVHQPEEDVCLAVRRGERRRPAEARAVVADDAMPLGERPKLRVPRPRVHDAVVDQRHGRPGAGVFDPEHAARLSQPRREVDQSPPADAMCWNLTTLNPVCVT